ncbi:amino acid adenylation protein [Actinoplanes ianthinogenes]|uniref:Amino acid adenylation protein n=1 Tax=Actinoplanes ianthinogenes TaxID=122358 RepID=A0ABM7LXR2_9ACTN|nr:amino acid adenylation protein [Actinoplanes ianthinogenes]GGQ95940.1 amino acid adenylation protein [Actinoplanes ianthinogenes]
MLIHKVIAAHAAEQPEAVAVIHRGSRVDYRTLDAAADACAAELAALGVGPGTIVPVSLGRSAHLAMTLLAVLKCGAAYAAIDRRWPAERVGVLLQLLAPPVLITDQPAPPGTPVCDPTGRGLDEWAAAGGTPPEAEITPDAPACVFFTSGTTGVPKGVLSPHRATTRLFAPSGPLAFGPGRVMCQASPPAWDAFSLELWGMLTTGGTAVVADDDHLLPHVLHRLIAEENVNTLWLTASLFNLFTDLEPECFTGLKHVITGGERLSPAHVERFLRRYPDITLANGYGPVESCVFATYHTITRADLERTDGIPLGRPVPGTGIHLVDDEICISGDGLALGYLGQEELTAERFVERVVDGRPVRVYRTGDLGRRDADELLHFRGRADRQVKIRGYRIEPAEIEVAAHRIDGLHQCVVVPVPAADGRPGSYDKLALFYTTATAVEPPAVRRLLASRLPHYSVPDVIRQVPAIPVTTNGKTDARTLLDTLTASVAARLTAP